MIGLARMAAQLADKRARRERGPHYVGIDFERSNPVEREVVARDPGSVPASLWYYTIIDRLSRGQRP